MVIVEYEYETVGKILLDIDLVGLAVVFDFFNAFCPPFVVGVFLTD